jgi:hypothetical protein
MGQSTALVRTMNELFVAKNIQMIRTDDFVATILPNVLVLSKYAIADPTVNLVMMRTSARG